MLTVDMLTHSFRKNMHQATLLTGDNDFKPLIDALVQDGMFITLWYPANETSAELMQAADNRRRLDMRGLHALLTPSSQEKFAIPQLKNFERSVNPGDEIGTWIDEKRCGLYFNGTKYVVTRTHDPNNCLHVWHTDFELLRDFCAESLDIRIPDPIGSTVHGMK